MRKELSKLYYKEKYNKVENYEFIAFFEKRGTDREKIDGKYVIRKRNAKILLKDITFNANIEKYYKRGGIKDFSLMNINNITLIEE